MNKLTPEERAFLAAAYPCDRCTHLNVFHWEGCLVPGCTCRNDDGISPTDHAEHDRIATITRANAAARAVEQAVDQ